MSQSTWIVCSILGHQNKRKTWLWPKTTSST